MVRNWVPTIEQYEDAIANALSAKQVKVLQTLYNFPNSTATGKELAEVLNYPSHKVAQFQIGKIGKTIANYLGVVPGTYNNGTKDVPAYFLIIGPYFLLEGKRRGQKDGWEMQENLVKALGRANSHRNYKTYLFTWNPEKWTWENIE